MENKLEITTVNPKEFGLTDETAQSITKDLPQILNERLALAEQYNEVIKLDINSPETLKKASDLRKLIKNNRTKGIENWHKVNKEYFLKGGQFIDAIKRKESFENERMEDALEQIEKHFENLEKERISNLHKERLELIKAYVDDTTALDLGNMAQDVFDAYLTAKKQAHEAKIEAERKTEEERLAKEKQEQEEREAQRLENIRLNAERVQREKEIEIERKKQEQILAKQKAEAEKALKAEQEKARIEKEKADAEAKRIQEENNKKLEAERIQREKLEAEIKAKKDAEEKTLKEQQAKELEAKKEAEKLAKAPIKKQLKVWVESFSIPELAIDNPTANVIKAKFESFKNWALEQTESI